MVKSKTVFVVGAGSSKEVNLPIGAELTTKIRERLQIKRSDMDATLYDQGIREALSLTINHNEYSKMALYLNACSLINAAMPLAPSIDNFLDTHSTDSDIELCGKLGIVSTILSAERNSALFVSGDNIYNRIQFGSLMNTWYVQLWRLLCTGVDAAQVDSIFNNVSFIVFNYDRCIEQFLFGALKTYYNLDDGKAAALMSKLQILHPYGSVGDLPALNNGRGVNYGGSVSGHTLLSAARQIKTFTERVEEGDQLSAIKEAIGTSEKVVFLGFAFHEINMSLLQTTYSSNKQTIFGTRLGFSDSDTSVIESRIENIFSHSDCIALPLAESSTFIDTSTDATLKKHLVSGTCTNLFQEFSLSIGE